MKGYLLFFNGLAQYSKRLSFLSILWIVFLLFLLLPLQKAVCTGGIAGVFNSIRTRKGFDKLDQRNRPSGPLIMIASKAVELSQLSRQIFHCNSYYFRLKTSF